MEYVAFEDKYLLGVLACLKRNYPSLGKMTDNELTKWIHPLIAYNWLEQVKNLHPWTRGCVLLNDDNEVVGYFGLVFSIQNINKQSLTVISPSTWAIDDNYRFYVFEFLQRLDSIQNVIFADFTPSESIRKIMLDFFNYEVIDNKKIIFYPIPRLGKKVKISPKSYTQLTGRERSILEDHKEYNVKCVEIIVSGEEPSYVFYKVEKHRFNCLLKLNRIQLLAVTEPRVFDENAKLIIWKLQLLEKGYLVTDSRFLSDLSPFGKNTYRCRTLFRLAKSENKYDKRLLGLLYTELSMLEY